MFTRIKNFFKKLADKVKAIFHSFMAKLSSILSRDSTFAKKYGDEFIRRVQNIRDDFEFKGYTFTIKKFSNRDDITFDSQLANIYINKAKVGETKIDNSIVNLLNPKGSVSDSLLNLSTFVESVGYYGDYYILNEYKISNVKNEYDKIYILHNIFPDIYNYNSLFSHDDDYIEDLYKNKTVLNDEQKNKVNVIFNKLNYGNLIKKLKPGVTTYGELYDLAIIFEKILSGNSINNFKDIAKQFNNIGHNLGFNMKASKNDINTLLNELRKNYIINPNLLGQYNPETSNQQNTGSSSGSGSQQQQNNPDTDYYSFGQYASLYQKIYKQVHFSSANNEDSFNKKVDEIEQKYKLNTHDRNGKITKSEADKCLKEIENLKDNYNKAYQAAQASGSGPSSSGSGSQQQQNSQTSSNKMSKKDFIDKIKVIKSKLNNGSFNNEFTNKFNSLLDDYKLNNDYFDNQVTELDKTNAEKYLAELEKFVEELNKRNPQSSSSGSTSNSGGNSGGSGSGSGSVGGRNIDYNSPAEKADVYKRANISIQDNSEDIHDTIRGAVAKLYTDNSSAADSYNERDFKNELFKLFRNGADKKDSIPASEIKKNASAIVDEVTTYKNTKDMAKESTNTVVKAIDSVINKLDEYIKRSNKNWTEGSDGTLTSNFTNLLTTITNVFFKTSRSDIVLANNIYLTALKDRCIQNKNIMVKVIAGYDSKKMKNTNESYDYDNDYIYNNNSNSFLDKGYWYYLQVK